MKKSVILFLTVVLSLSCCACCTDPTHTVCSCEQCVSSQDISYYPATKEQLLKESTHIMIAYNMGASKEGDRAIFGFAPLHLIKGELEKDALPIPYHLIEVVGSVDEYDYINTYAQREVYLLILKYDKESGRYRDMQIAGCVMPLNVKEISLPDEWKSLVENIYNNESGWLKWLEELMQESDKLLDSSDSTTAE